MKTYEKNTRRAQNERKLCL